MNDQTMSEVSCQLARPERKIHRSRQVWTLVFLAVVTLVIMQQANVSKIPKVIEAESFILRDTTGKIRATLSIDSNGNPELTLKDKEQRVLTQLHFSQWGEPRLNLIHKNGKAIVNLGVGADASTGLALTHTDGRFGAMLGVDSKGTSELRLFDKQGGTRVELFAETNSRQRSVSLTKTEIFV